MGEDRTHDADGDSFMMIPSLRQRGVTGEKCL